MGDPEHIGEILKRVFRELEKQYKGGFPLERKQGTSTPLTRQTPVEAEHGKENSG